MIRNKKIRYIIITIEAPSKNEEIHDHFFLQAHDVWTISEDGPWSALFTLYNATDHASFLEEMRETRAWLRGTDHGMWFVSFDTEDDYARFRNKFSEEICKPWIEGLIDRLENKSSWRGAYSADAGARYEQGWRRGGIFERVPY